MMKITLKHWMNMMWLPQVDGAEKYRIGQDLTKKQATEIMGIIADSVGFPLNDPRARKRLNEVGSDYRNFIVVYMALILVAGDLDSSWYRTLWDVLHPADQVALEKIVSQKMKEIE